MVDSLLVGGLTPFAVRAAGLSVITGFGAPESRSFSLTLPVQQTVTMDVGQYTVNNTVIINYALTVPDGQTSGPFVFDATISAELSYDEAANGETNLFNLHLGGSYSLTFHAEGNYDSGSGVTWFVGSYTADEFGGASFRAEQNITYQGALGGSSSRVITNLSDMERHETGNFDESGSTAEYDLRQFDDMTFSFSDSGDY
ncbi:MAG: hypothetical protein HY000_23430, partial [Planctomycetes bacterium]|nr:hypothetical protein [Planctomycetota bacterium]